MSSMAYEGNLKAWLLTAQPAGWDPVNGSVVTEAELDAGTLLERLVSDGGVSINSTANTASQPLLDDGKISHDPGTREKTGSITHQLDKPVENDSMRNLYAYGDERYLVVSPQGVPTADGQLLHLYFFGVGDDPQERPAARDTKQNFMVPMAIKNWDVNATFDAT